MNDYSEKHLLFALLACQNELITKPQLVAAFSVWLGDRSKGLDLILVDQGSLSEQQRFVLDSLVDLHLAKHGDLQKSLAQLSSMDGIVQELHSLASPDIAATLPLAFSEFATSLHLPNANRDPALSKLSNSDDRFRIIRHHANGGLGVVHVAEDQQLRREVALKQIRTDFADSDAYRSKFIQEAEVTGQLEHPGIVPVYGLGTDATGRPYYAMRFIKGEELKTRIQSFHKGRKNKSQSLDTPELRNLLRRFTDVCDAIDYAHDRGVLHRDLKPGNVMLGKHGETLVVDWGLAKPMKQAPEADPWSTLGPSVELPFQPSGSQDDSATAYGSFLGTPAYAPPEQISGELDKLCPQSDVYSLGAILYEILTGRPPVEKANSQAMLLALHTNNKIPAPRSLDATIPKPLNAICQKAISFKTTDRYATANELKEDIERWLDDSPVIAFPEPISLRAKRWIQKHQALVATTSVVVLMSAIGLGLGLMSAIISRNNVALTEANNREMVERTNAVQQESVATKSLAELREQTKEASKALFDAGVFEYQLGRLQSGTDKLMRSWKLRLNDDPLKEPYRNILVDRLSRGGRSWIALHHDYPIHYVAFSPDGRRLATASQENIDSKKGIARLWDVQTGAALGEPMNHNGEVKFIAFSPDGSTVATTSRDRTHRMWNAETGVALTEPIKHDKAYVVFSAAFSPDGNRLATLETNSKGHRIRLWDAHTGSALNAVMEHKNRVISFHFSSDGRRITTASEDRMVCLWDAETGVMLGEPIKNGLDAKSTKLSPDGRYAATTSTKNTVVLWDTFTNSAFGKPMKHETYVASVTFGPDDNRLATVTDNDSTLHLWDVQAGVTLCAPIKHTSRVSYIEFSPDSTRVATTSEDNMMRLWDAQTGDALGEPMKDDDQVTSVAFSPDGSRIATACWNSSSPRLWDVLSNSQLAEPMKHNESVSCISFSPDGSRITTASSDGTVSWWDAQTGTLLGEPRKCGFSFLSNVLNYDSRIWCIALSPDGRRLATGTKEGQAILWETRTGFPQGVVMKHDFSAQYSNVQTIAFSPDNSRLATGSLDLTARVWDTKTGIAIGEPMKHDSHPTVVAFSPDGRQLAIGTLDGTASVWDVQSGTLLCPLLQHQFEINSIVFSPNGNLVATASNDKTARLWNAQTGAFLCDPIKHNGHVVSIAFSPDSRRLATSDGTVRIWDSQTGAPLGEPIKHEKGLYCITFSPDGSQLATASADKAVRIWDVQVKDPKNIPSLINNFSANRDSSVPPDRKFDEDLKQFHKKRAFHYHASTALKAVARKNWFAAKFHLPWLIEQEPDNPRWKKLLDEVNAAQKP